MWKNKIEKNLPAQLEHIYMPSISKGWESDSSVGLGSGCGADGPGSVPSSPTDSYGTVFLSEKWGEAINKCT